MANIRVTPETLDVQGKDLIKFAEALATTLESIDKKISQITDGWDGLGQDAYFEMYSTMKKSLDEFPKLVNGLGEATVSAAEAYSTVDEKLQGGFRGQGA